MGLLERQLLPELRCQSISVVLRPYGYCRGQLLSVDLHGMTSQYGRQLCTGERAVVHYISKYVTETEERTMA